MEGDINKIHKLLLKNRKTIAVAESCTGGILSNLLTKTPGSSRYFILGIVAYSNTVKEGILKIPHRIITKKGAVSKEVAAGLAHSARRLAGVDFGIGITGIAGPKGATPRKPVGTVFIAIDGKRRKLCRRFSLKGSRTKIKNKAALKALKLLGTLIQ
ncbi:MAG: CinA family protein [Candidatus Omnitrophota bacterium]